MAAKRGFTAGLEEELFVIDQATFAPVVPTEACVAALSQRLGTRYAGEYKAGVVELVTTVHRCPFELVEEVAANRCEANAILARFGYVALPMAMLPAVDCLDLPAREGERYRWIEGRKGDAVRRLGANGVHLHIGTMLDDEERLRVIRQVVDFALIHAAVTSASPFAYGRDTGQASWRLRTLMQLASPLPFAPANLAEMRRTYEALRQVGGPRDASEQWGLVRLGAGKKPGEKPTIEFRGADTTASLDHLVWLVALTAAAVDAARQGQLPARCVSDPVADYFFGVNADSVARDGQEAMLVDTVGRLSAKSVPALISAWEERLQPSIERAGAARGNAAAARRPALLLARDDGSVRRHRGRSRPARPAGRRRAGRRLPSADFGGACREQVHAGHALGGAAPRRLKEERRKQNDHHANRQPARPGELRRAAERRDRSHPDQQSDRGRGMPEGLHGGSRPDRAEHLSLECRSFDHRGFDRRGPRKPGAVRTLSRRSSANAAPYSRRRFRRPLPGRPDHAGDARDLAGRHRIPASGGRYFLSQVMRRWKLGGGAHPHIDQSNTALLAPFGIRRRFGLNVYLEMPSEGGAVEFWNRYFSDEEYTRLRQPPRITGYPGRKSARPTSSSGPAGGRRSSSTRRSPTPWSRSAASANGSRSRLSMATSATPTPCCNSPRR